MKLKYKHYTTGFTDTITAYISNSFRDVHFFVDSAAIKHDNCKECRAYKVISFFPFFC